MRVVRIPEERVGVLIGEDGDNIEQVQDLTGADIRTEDNEITVESDDPLDEMTAANIVKAVGRGFSVEKALRLLEDNASLIVIDVNDFTNSDSGKERLKGRVIGRSGEAKEHIENTTDTELAIYGKTVSIIGPVANLEVAKRAVEMLLSGSSHAAAYREIEQNMGKLV